VDTIVDDDESASTRAKGTREGWERVIAAIGSGDVDVLVTWEFSRATRDLEVFLTLRKQLQAAGVLLSYKGDLYDLRKVKDRRRVAHDAVDAESEADETSERALRAKARLAELGLPAGSIAYGYRRVYDPRSGDLVRQEPDEPGRGEEGTAAVVRELVERFLAGTSLNQLAVDMNTRGIRTPKPPRDAARARGWTASTVGQILRGPAIAGVRAHRRPGQEPVFFEAAWEPLITADERARILTILSDPARVIHRGIEPTHLLSHLAVCGICGVPVRHRVKRQKGVVYPAYTCDQTKCRGVYVQAPPADDLVEQAVLAVVANPQSLLALRGDTARSVKARDEAKAKVAELEAEVAELTEAYRAKRISAMAFALALDPLEAELTTARAGTTTRAAGPAVLRLATADDHAAAWRAFTIPERRDVVRALFEVRLHRAAVKGTRTWDPRRVELLPRGAEPILA